jgi:hypothetical protein
MVDNKDVVGKNFNFYINETSSFQYTYNDDGLSHLDHYRKSLRVDVSHAGKLLEDFDITLVSGGHDSRGYWGVLGPKSGEKQAENNVSRDSVAKLIRLIDAKHKGYSGHVDYDPARDKISYDYNPLRREPRALNWSQQHSAKHLSDIIEEEMKRLVSKNKAREERKHV